MSKPIFVISCPIDTYSGYGARARDVVKAVINTDKYDVKILPQRWGATPWGYIEDHPEWHFLQPYILQQPQLDRQPEIWMQITIPNEYQPVGKYNIGVTAGIETNLCHPSWLEGINRMNLTLVSSEHAKTVFQHTRAEQKDNKTNQTIKVIELQKPVEVLFEGVDLEKYFEVTKFENQELYNDILGQVKEDFAFLFVGHWVKGDFGEDRKNVGFLIKNFLQTFKGKMNPPALILKTSFASASKMDRAEILKRINAIKKTLNSNRLPNVYVLLGDMKDSEVNELYNHPKVKAMVCFTKGEGFGRPMLEFSMTGKPILTTNWSGHLDFLKSEFTPLVGGTLEKIHPSAAVENILIEGSSWFSPDPIECSKYLKDIFENYKSFKERAKKQRHFSRTNFSFEKMQELLDSLLDKNIPEFPKQVALQLPKLQKVGTSEAPKLQLPKLQKVNG